MDLGVVDEFISTQSSMGRVTDSVLDDLAADSLLWQAPGNGEPTCRFRISRS